MVSYKRIYIGVGTTIITLFALLMAVGLEITDLSGDIACSGTTVSPCLSYLRITNPTFRNIYIYNKDEVKMEFSPLIKDYALFVEDGRCSGKLTGSSCSCYSNGNELAYKGYRCVDFTNRTKPKKDALYVYNFPAYSSKKYLLVGFKFNPTDEIKWTLGVKKELLDPIWQSTFKTHYINKTVEVLYYELENVTYFRTNCSWEYVKCNCTTVNETYYDYESPLMEPKYREVEVCTKPAYDLFGSYEVPCTEGWANTTCNYITYVKQEMVRKIKYESVNDYVISVDFNLIDTKKTIVFDRTGYNMKGCYLVDTTLTCWNGDGWSPNRAEQYKNVCLDGESCKQWDISTGKVIRSTDGGGFEMG